MRHTKCKSVSIFISWLFILFFFFNSNISLLFSLSHSFTLQRHETARGVSKTHVLRRKNFNRVDLTRVYRNEYFNLCRMLMWNIVIRNESQNVNTIFIFCIRTMIYAIYTICIYIYTICIYITTPIDVS